MKSYVIRPTTDADRPWIARLLAERWGGVSIVSRGKTRSADRLTGFGALQEDRPLGLVTYAIEDGGCEIVSLDSLVERRGIGTALVRAVIDAALAAGANRVWLVTTNDNVPAIRFYERREFRVSAVHHGAVDMARRLKPSIPLTGIGGVPIHDEVEMEIFLAPG